MWNKTEFRSANDMKKGLPVEVVSVPLLMSLGWSKYSLSHSREAAEYACKGKVNSNIEALKFATCKKPERFYNKSDLVKENKVGIIFILKETLLEKELMQSKSSNQKGKKPLLSYSGRHN